MSKQGKAELDAIVLEGLKAQGMAHTAIVDDEEIDGYFLEEDVVAGEGDDALTLRYRHFDCAAGDLPTDVPNTIEVVDEGMFHVQQRKVADGGRVLLILGTKLP